MDIPMERTGAPRPKGAQPLQKVNSQYRVEAGLHPGLQSVGRTPGGDRTAQPQVSHLQHRQGAGKGSVR